MSSSLPDPSPNPQILSLPVYLPSEADLRSLQEQYWDGFLTFYECNVAGAYLSAGELAALTPSERRGYNAAIQAADAAEYDTFRMNRNAFGDLTEY